MKQLLEDLEKNVILDPVTPTLTVEIQVSHSD